MHLLLVAVLFLVVRHLLLVAMHLATAVVASLLLCLAILKSQIRMTLLSYARSTCSLRFLGVTGVKLWLQGSCHGLPTY